MSCLVVVQMANGHGGLRVVVLMLPAVLIRDSYLDNQDHPTHHPVRDLTISAGPYSGTPSPESAFPLHVNSQPETAAIVFATIQPSRSQATIRNQCL